MIPLNSASKKACTTANSTARKALLSVTVLCLSFFTVGVAQTSANPTVRRSVSQTFSQKSSTKELAVIEDGTYLFGQSSQRDQIGTSYAVFSVANNRAVGAFYQPNSSFDCFSGQVYPDRMALNVVDSYQQTVHPYSVALTTDSSLTAGSAAPAYTLQGFHRIEALSDRDMEILAVCEADFAR